MPIHSLHGPSSGYDGHGQGQAQYQQQQQQRNGSRPTETHATAQPSYQSQQPSSSSAYPRPQLDTRNSTFTASSSTSTSSSSNPGGDRYERASRSPPRDYHDKQASSSSYPQTNAEPPTPNSFLRSPPLGPIAHLQQPVFPHHQPQHPDSQRRPEQLRYDSSSSADAYGAYPTSSTYDNGRDYSNGASSSSFPTGPGGGYGSYGADDIEDLSFNRPPQPQTYSTLAPLDEERKVFATLHEVEPSHAPEEAVGEQTAFISKVCRHVHRYRGRDGMKLTSPRSISSVS